MTRAPEHQAMDRLVKWCIGVFLFAGMVLGALLAYSLWSGNLIYYVTTAGLAYLLLSVIFLGIVFVAFVGGHLGSSKEIEAPKIELFEMEKRR